MAESQTTAWLLVTAHPDDEAMFFIPTLRNILSSNEGTIIQILCLSNGDYRDVSDGPMRTKEMLRACSVIGVHCKTQDVSAVTVLNDARMKDGPNEVWSSDLVSESVMDHICNHIIPKIAIRDNRSAKPQHEYLLSDPDKVVEMSAWKLIEKRPSKQSSTSKKEPTQTINLNILTFDKGGVSGHPNHVDTFKGVQYLLNDKCYITHDNKLEPIAKLWACQEIGSQKKPNENMIEFNISAYTLNTISNPLQKYFAWAFFDIIPYLMIRLFQTVCYLIFFLLGGLLWSNKAPQIQPLSGIDMSTDGKSIQYKIVEPILVWRAMAAHHSQFVWYRRLSVMFSRYTFINDLQKLVIDTPPFDVNDEDEVTSLPPVVTAKEGDDSFKFLLTTPQMNSLRAAVLPPSLHHRPWTRIYSLSRDGDSFVAFQKQFESWNSKNSDPSTILVVRTTAGELIGGFADVPIIPLASNMIGSAARSCLFKVQQQSVEVYGKHCTSTSKRIVFDATRRRVAFGGGDSDAGGPDEGFGLCLEDAFTRGTTARCAAFRNEPLVSDKDGIFDVVDVEVWGFVFGQF